MVHMIITKEKLEEIKKYIDDNFCDLWDEDEEDDDIDDVCLGVQRHSYVKGAPLRDDFDDYFDDLAETHRAQDPRLAAR